MSKKTLQDLTIKDNFMFGAVMEDPENSKKLLELILGKEIDHVETSIERQFHYHPEYRGIRLDVFAKDERNTHYNVEMQVVKQEIHKRSRYYHSQMDMDMIRTGVSYEELPDSYVIFICDFDPVGEEKYCYTVTKRYEEKMDRCFEDGSDTIYLSTVGTNEKEVPVELVKFLKFVSADLEDSKGDFQDEFVEKLQRDICRIKSSREMGEKYMLFELMMQQKIKEGEAIGIKKGEVIGIKKGEALGIKIGKAEDILSFLEELGEVPKEIRECLLQMEDLNALKLLLRKAAKAESIQEFCVEMEKIVTR